MEVCITEATRVTVMRVMVIEPHGCVPGKAVFHVCARGSSRHTIQRAGPVADHVALAADIERQPGALVVSDVGRAGEENNRVIEEVVLWDGEVIGIQPDGSVEKVVSGISSGL